MQVTGAVGWRKDNLKYKKNEVFLDIVEQVNMLMSSQGAVLRCDVNGKVVMKVFLSGMPDVKLGLNDALEVSFHYVCISGKMGRNNPKQGSLEAWSGWGSQERLWGVMFGGGCLTMRWRRTLLCGYGLAPDLVRLSGVPQAESGQGMRRSRLWGL